MTGGLFAPRSIPVLTLWEPWGSLIVAGFKRHETRHWATKVRGQVAIHAAQRCERDVDSHLDELCVLAFGKDWRKTRPTGCVLAVADLTACVPTDMLCEGRPPLIQPIQESDYISGNYDDGRFGFKFERVRPLADPLPLKSRQTPFWGWTPPEDLDARLLAPVDHFAAAARWEARS